MRLQWGFSGVVAVAPLAVLAGCGGTLTGGSDGGQPDATTGPVPVPGGPGLNDESGSGSSGGSSSGSGSGSSGGSSSGSGSGSNSNMCPPGSPLDCYVDKNCSANPTTIVGKVFDPAGKNPLQNVLVFVPNDPARLPQIVPGASTCSSCDTSVGAFVTFTFTGADGSFRLTGVPTGQNVPLVLQIGKWRRIITVPDVVDCATTQLPSSGTGQARLPRNHMEGDMPGMALLTGGLDDLGCFLTRMGIAASEYTSPHGGGRLDVYQGLGLAGNGPGLTNATPGNCTDTSCPLWASKQSLESYDIVLLACEGDTFDPDAQTNGADGGGMLSGAKANVTKAGKQALHDWLNEGGKVFATHFHYTWFQNGPPDFQAVANWKGYSLGTGVCNDCAIDTSFQGGHDFDAWLNTAGALSGTGINLTGVADSVSSVTSGSADRWIYDPSSGDAKYLSFNLPIGGNTNIAERYCGKAVFTDLHAGGSPSGDLPGSCKVVDLSAQEKALEYLFFDLSACVRNESMPLPNPTQPPK
jgi:hypothetical protein